ncbi:LapA family protein [Roseomonas sp. CCTCC AB2023176]|uniref:LapA family protein n=1 Tax=Roseomonas sp. CCTCC AB2023176 TaxID=3342640 RepID=UPI0035E0BF38
MWRLLLIGPLLVLLILFALSNMAPVPVTLWPFDLVWQAPLAMAVLAVSAVAFLLGAFVAWSAGMRARRDGRAAMRERDRLLAEVSEYRAREAKRVEAERFGEALPAESRALRTAAYGRSTRP